LLFAETLSSEIREAGKERKNRKTSIRSIISGKILWKYKLIRYAAKKTNTDRWKLSKVKHKVINPSKPKRGFEPKLQGAVINFYNRDDVSTALPENRDSKKLNKGSPVFKSEYLMTIWVISIKNSYPNILTCRAHSHHSLEWDRETLCLQTLRIEELVCASNIKTTRWSWKCWRNIPLYRQIHKFLSNTVTRRSLQSRTP